jgi:hypothetical protein
MIRAPAVSLAGDAVSCRYHGWTMALNPNDVHVTRHLTRAQMQEEIDAVEERLLEPDRRWRFDRDLPWHFKNKPGVYAIFVGGVVAYFGETRSLKRRMRNLKRSDNHTFRRKMGNKLFKGRAGFRALGKGECFSAELEAELSAHMDKHVHVCGVHVRFGRKEIEEYLNDNRRPEFCGRDRHR